jgi:hypothetical protein
MSPGTPDKSFFRLAIHPGFNPANLDITAIDTFQ